MPSPADVVQEFHRRMHEEKRVDWALWAKKPNVLLAWLIGLGRHQAMPAGHRVVSEEGDEAVVEFVGLRADGHRVVENGARYKAFLRRVDGQWRIVRFGE